MVSYEMSVKTLETAKELEFRTYMQFKVSCRSF
jgi:hypothetical protein